MAIEPVDSAPEKKCYRVQDAMDFLVQDYSETVTLICPPAVDIGLVRKVILPLAEELQKHVTILIGEGMDICESDETLAGWLVRKRCAWADTPLLAYYHDFEWGHLPDTDSKWFEFVTLEIFQAGLSWKTILRKRIEFRKAFCGFDIEQLALFNEDDIQRLLQNPGIVRNKKKIEVTIENAKIAKNFQDTFGSFDEYIRSTCLHTEAHKILNMFTETFRFVGPTTADSIATATGLVPPTHDEHCYLCD